MNKNHNYTPDAIPVPELGTASYKGIHQLYKNIKNDHQHIFPVTYTLSVYDGKTGANLEHILHLFNHIFLQFLGTPLATRNLLPKDMRRKGIMITYRDMDNNVVTETNIDESESTSDNWGLDEYWVAYGCTAAKKSGTTSERPASDAISVGFIYFDTDLGKSIVWNGSAWVNMDGTVLE